MMSFLERSGRIDRAWASLRGVTVSSPWQESGRLIMLILHSKGPCPVPDLARARGVSRQSIQSTVDRLRREGSLQLTPNPAHRRSPLVQLTPAGRARVRQQIAEEEAVASALHIGVSDESLTLVKRVLSAVEEALERELAERRSVAK